MKKAINPLVWANVCWSLSLWLLCLTAVWIALAQQSFFYEQWYQLLDIDKTINEYAPLNRFERENFVETNSEEHARLFTAITQAVHQQGNGLSAIEYSASDGKVVTLLTKDEVIHLQDVANLIATATIVMKVVAMIFIFSSLLMRYKEIAITPLKLQWVYAGGLMAVLLVLSLAVGVESLFYWLHTIVFPDNHQWFFYYEDSLMSTLMQAPNIFLPIGVVWIIGVFCLWSIAVVMSRRI
ncbi:hypothetical protein IMCC1989_2190 [gamma proteobacterium IMCC1989]|nr:hypothetical protein IMCC1989_2190 [gamma proteobacterium IMCC1989]